MKEEKGMKKKLVFRMLSYMKPYKAKLALIFFCLALTTVLGFLQPLIIRSITDDGLVGKDMERIIVSVILLLILVLLNQLIEVWQTRTFADLHNASTFTLFHQAFHKLLHLKKSFYDDKNNAEILNFVNMDVSRVSMVTDRYMALMVGQVFQVISGLAGLIIINWKLTLMVLAVAPVKYFAVKVLAKRNEKKMEEMIESSRDFSGWFGDIISGIGEVKLWNLLKPKSAVFTQKQKKLLETEKASTMISAWNSFAEAMLEWGVTGLLYIVGGILVISGELSIGGVFAFLSYSGYVTGPISAVLNMRFFFSQIFPSAKRLFTLLDTEEEQSGTDSLPASEDMEIRFQNVSFAYENAGRQVLEGVDFFLRKGEKVAVIGQNGSGKSTLLNLILRFIEPESGHIDFCGKNIAQLDLQQYRRLFAVVSQEPYLFDDTVENNINLTGDAKAEEVRRAARQSGAEDFIERMPEKEKSKIGRNGARLSGGEKQKLAVARAIIKDAPIIILDEATSGYDVESDRYLYDMLQNELRDKTVISITHRYDNLKGMDRVYRLEEGRLVLAEEKNV